MEIVKFLNENFWKDSDYFLLIILSVIYILWNKKGEIRGKRMVIYSILVFSLIICNPFVARLGLIFFGEDRYAYMRIFYLIPIMSLIAYAGTEFYTNYVMHDDKRTKKVVFVAAICITIMLCGSTYEKTMYREAANIYKIDQNALEISDMINEDCDKKPVVIYTPSVTDIHYGIRQYAGNIMIAGDSATITDMEMLHTIVEEGRLDYIVLTEANDLLDYIMEEGFRWLGESGEYIVFKRADSET